MDIAEIFKLSLTIFYYGITAIIFLISLFAGYIVIKHGLNRLISITASMFFLLFLLFMLGISQLAFINIKF